MQAAYAFNQNRIMDPSTAGVQTSFGHDGSQLVNNAGFHAKYETNPHMRVPFATATNTTLSKMMTRVLDTVARETVTIAPDNPWLGRLAPAVPTPELKVQKNILDIVRQIAPYAPHFSAPRKQRIRTMTRIRQQTRKTWGMSIEKTQLYSQEGRNYLTALLRGVRENIAATLIYEAQMEFLQSAKDYQEENYKFGNNPYENIHGMQAVSQGNAIMAYSQIRRDMFASLSKDGDQFRAVLDRIKTMLIEHRNANPDALIVGPGIKSRLALGDRKNSTYYIAGDAGSFLRVNGERTVDTYLDLDIIETLAVNPDEEIRSTFTREVEVGEHNLLIRNKNAAGSDFKSYHRNIRIYNQETDSMEIISLADVVRHAPDFGYDGEISPKVHALAREYNSGAKTHFQRVHHLSREIAPSSISLFVFGDSHGKAKVATVYGQIEKLGGTAGIKQTIDSALAMGGMTQDEYAEIADAIENGQNLLDRIKSVDIGANSFANKGTDPQRARVLRAGNNAVIDAQGNEFGSLDPTGAISLAGYANGAGIRTLAKGGANVPADVAAQARDFVNAVTKLTTRAGRGMHSSKTVRAATPDWFHKPNKVSAFIDLMAGVQLPIWLPTGGAPGGPAANTTPQFANVNGSDLDAVERALGTRGGNILEVPRVQLQLLEVVSSGQGAASQRAEGLLQEIARALGANQGRLAGLAAIDYRAGLILSARGVEQVPGSIGLLSHLLSIGDLSPASYIQTSSDDVSGSVEHLVRFAAAIANLSDPAAQAWVAEGVEAKNKDDNDKSLKKWWKKAPKLAAAQRVLDEFDYTTVQTFPNDEEVGEFVRTGLTVSRTQLATILADPQGAGYRVSNPDAPWAPLTAAANNNLDNNPFVAGGAGIGEPLEMHEVTFFANKFESISEDVRSSMAPRGRKRGLDFDSDDEEDYGYGFEGPAQARGANMYGQSFNRGGELASLDDVLIAPRRNYSGASDMDLAGSSSSTAGIGARFPGSRQTREQYGVDPIGMGPQYNEYTSPAMQNNYAAAMSLGTALDRTLALSFLLLPINRDSAIALAESADAPFGGLIARPHIRHLTSTAMVVESGPSTAMTHFTETDVSSTANDTKEWTYNITWQSTAFVHNPQWVEIFHDCLLLGYAGGNGATFFKRHEDESGPARIYDPVLGAQASIYAFIIGAYERPPNPFSLTGVHHITGFDNNVKDSDIPVPHYTSAPLAEATWGFSKLAKIVHRGEGLVDQTANTLCYIGLTDIHTGSNVTNDYVVGQENTGHLGKTKPNDGLKDVRNGTAIIG